MIGATKISEFATFVVGNPRPGVGGRYFVFLKLVTDDGIEGLGEVYVSTFGPHTVTRMIEDVIERHVLGADPFQIERLWRNVYGRGYTARPDISLMGVLSGIEMACWDIVGKAVDKPVYALHGGQVHERLRTYTYIYAREGDSADVYADPTWPPGGPWSTSSWASPPSSSTRLARTPRSTRVSPVSKPSIGRRPIRGSRVTD